MQNQTDDDKSRISTKDLEELPKEITAEMEVSQEDKMKLSSYNKETLQPRMFHDIEYMFSRMKEKQEKEKSNATKLQEEFKVFTQLSDNNRKITDTDMKIKEIRLALNKLTKNN